MKSEYHNSKSSQFDLFKQELKQIINLKHPLVKISSTIDWNRFYSVFGKCYCTDNGRPAIDTRLMVCLHYLKYLNNLSDKEVVSLWTENPYWQYFSGMKYFQHELPIDSSSMTNWRKRIKDIGAEELLSETIKTGLKLKIIKTSEIKKVNIDTTVQEKAIRYPTDSRLYDRAREKLVSLAKKEGINLRQNYNKVSKLSLLMQSRYLKARQMKRARKCTNKLNTYLGRVIRDIERKCENPSEKMSRLLKISKRIQGQKRNDKNKIYSIHETEISCISKGKPHKKYEFGNKVGIATTVKNNWIVASLSFKGSPYDGNTTRATIEQTKRLTNIIPKFVFVDNGYKGDESKKVEEDFDTNVFVDQKRRGKVSKYLWKQMKQRARIEPIIGHLKNDYRMNKNLLKGTQGDSVNAILSAAGMNLRKLLKSIEFLLLKIIEWIVGEYEGEKPKLDELLIMN